MDLKKLVTGEGERRWTPNSRLARDSHYPTPKITDTEGELLI